LINGIQNRLKVGAAAAGKDGEFKLHSSFLNQV
jgi:hypothetical protein